jgi:hypothetical protein
VPHVRAALKAQFDHPGKPGKLGREGYELSRQRDSVLRV